MHLPTHMPPPTPTCHPPLPHTHMNANVLSHYPSSPTVLPLKCGPSRDKKQNHKTVFHGVFTACARASNVSSSIITTPSFSISASYKCGYIQCLLILCNCVFAIVLVCTCCSALTPLYTTECVCVLGAIEWCTNVCTYAYLLPAGTIPAAQLAVDRINNDSSILPNHYLRLQTGLDSMVSII